MKNKSNKSENGITLIVLVITIIILLILAGVTITTLTGENGLLNRAKSAKETSVNSQIQENAILADYEGKVDKYVSSDRQTLTDWTLVTSFDTFDSSVVKTIDLSNYTEVNVRAMDKSNNWIWDDAMVRVNELENTKGMWLSFFYSTANFVNARVDITKSTVSWKSYVNVASIIDCIEIWAK